MNLSKEKIKEIAESLDAGMICYIHKQTHEIKEMMDLDEYPDGREFWEEDLKEIEANIDDYFKMEKMPSRDSFRIMAAFVETLSPSKIKWRLESILERKRPFRNFKDEVDYNENIRQQWFKFKDWKHQEWVKEYIENHFEEEEEEEEEEDHPYHLEADILMMMAIAIIQIYIPCLAYVKAAKRKMILQKKCFAI